MRGGINGQAAAPAKCKVGWRSPWFAISSSAMPRTEPLSNSEKSHLQVDETAQNGIACLSGLRTDRHRILRPCLPQRARWGLGSLAGAVLYWISNFMGNYASYGAAWLAARRHFWILLRCRSHCGGGGVVFFWLVGG